MNKRNNKLGKVYTPTKIVRLILDLTGYQGDAIHNKHVIDNSCGDGAFLCEIVRRYCNLANKDTNLKDELETYIHGIDIDEIAVKECRQNLNLIAKEFGLTDLNWDVKPSDALFDRSFNNKMNFVVGNPPYIRIHNVNNIREIKTHFKYFQNGMSDLYLAFFEIGLNMLAEKGTLGYITPSSYFNSLAGVEMRADFVKRNLINTVVDLKHIQVFDNATTYTAITILKKGRLKSDVNYQEYKQAPVILNSNDFYFDKKFSFAKKSDLSFLKEVASSESQNEIKVKNGFATLCDSVFIANSFPFESDYIIPVIKASKGEYKKIIFPYDNSSVLLSENTLKGTAVYQYLCEHYSQLENRSLEDHSKWYSFGRTQGIADVYKDKLTLNTIIRNVSDLKILSAPNGTGVYSGLYITSSSYPLNQIKEILLTDEFVKYVKLLAKYKSGGYYTFSSKDVQKYLDYKIGKIDKIDNQK